MKNFLLFTLIFFCTGLKAQSWQWALKYGADGPDYNQPLHMVLDSAGDAYVFGTYGNGTQLNNADLPWFASHDANTYIAKFDKEGNCLWHKEINSQNRNDNATFLQIKNDKIYLWASVHFDGYYNTFFLDTTVYGGDITQQWNANPNFFTSFPWIPDAYLNVIVCLDLNGNILNKTFLSLNSWRQIIGFPYPSAFHVDKNNNYYVVGYLGTATTFPDKKQFFINNVGFDSITQQFNGQPVLFKISPQNQLLWYKYLVAGYNGANISPNVNFQDVVSDTSGNMYYTGYASLNTSQLFIAPPEDVMFDNTHALHFENSHDEIMFLMKMDTSGSIQWLKQTTNYIIDSTLPRPYSIGKSIILSKDDNKLFISGSCTPKTKNNPNYLLFTPTDTLLYNFNRSFTSTMGFIACYDTDGNFLWKQITPTTWSSTIGDLEYHNHSLYSGLRWNDSLKFQNNWLTTPSGISGFNYCKWNTSGNLIEIKKISSTGNSNPYVTRIDLLGNIIAGGTLDNSLDFGGHVVSDYGVSYLARWNNRCSDTVLNKPNSGLHDTTLCANVHYNFTANPANVYYQWQDGHSGNNLQLFYAAAGTDTVVVTAYNGKCYWPDTLVYQITSCIGIDEAVQNPLKVYPNPADKEIHVELPQYYSQALLRVFNATGSLQFSTALHTKTYSLNVSQYARGLYLIQLQTPEGVFSRKVELK